MPIQTVVINDAEVVAKLQQLSAPDLRSMLDDVGGYMASVTRQRFKTSTDPEGRPWLPLAQSTLLARAGGKQAIKKGGGLTKRAQGIMANSRPLVRQGHLRDSVTYRVHADYVEIGTGDATKMYAPIHQFGGMAGRGRKVKIPARPFLGVSPENREEIQQIMLDHVNKAVNK